jgi:hypothetical protein
MTSNVDLAVEALALREHGLIGRGDVMGNALFAIDYSALPPEAHRTIQAIITGGPFPYAQDGTSFGNRFGDLPSRGEYLEFTVATPGVSNRGARRIVARKNGVLFFTACHYERVPGTMSAADRQVATAHIDARWRNGFYAVTGLSALQRDQIASGIARVRATRPA